MRRKICLSLCFLALCCFALAQTASLPGTSAPTAPTVTNGTTGTVGINSGTNQANTNGLGSATVGTTSSSVSPSNVQVPSPVAVQQPGVAGATNQAGTFPNGNINTVTNSTIGTGNFNTPTNGAIPQTINPSIQVISPSQVTTTTGVNPNIVSPGQVFPNSIAGQFPNGNMNDFSNNNRNRISVVQGNFPAGLMPLGVGITFPTLTLGAPIVVVSNALITPQGVQAFQTNVPGVVLQNGVFTNIQ